MDARPMRLLTSKLLTTRVSTRNIPMMSIRVQSVLCMLAFLATASGANRLKLRVGLFESSFPPWSIRAPTGTCNEILKILLLHHQLNTLVNFQTFSESRGVHRGLSCRVLHTTRPGP